MRPTGIVEQRGDPYVGPRPFGVQDRHRFHGRDRQAHELANHWQANPVTILCGPSGVGKTSLIHAGVLPLLDPDFIDVLPVGSLAHVAGVPAAALGEGHNPHVLAVLASWSPHEPPSGLAGLTIRAFLERRPAGYNRYGDPQLTLVAVDQAEDLLTAPGGEHAAGDDFLHQLGDALETCPDLRVLLTLHEDQLPMLSHRGKPFKQALEYRLTALDADAALAAVDGPLLGTGRTFAAGAARRLVDDLLTVRLDTPDGEETQRLALVEPLHLQVVCSALWAALPAGERVITVEQVSELGDTGRALAGFCDRMIEEAAHEVFHGETDLLRTALRGAFVTGRGRRRPVGLGATETAGLPNTVIRALVDRHILRLEEYPAGGQCLLSHDHLVRALMRGGAGKHADAPPDLAEHRRRAELALREGDFQRAATYAEVALRHCGPNMRRRAEIESLLGDIAYRDDRLAGAVEHHSRAAALLQGVAGADAELAAQLLAIGRIRIRQGHLELALNELEAAARRRPGDPAVQTQLALALWAGGSANGALDLLDEVLGREGDRGEALRARGEILADLGRSEAALRDLGQVGPLSSPSARAAYALALALAGRIAEAMECVPAAEGETSAVVLLRIARVHEAAGRTEEAAVLARRARESRLPLPVHLAAEAGRLGGF
jgi:tetratricopeptide (TPR) repeat protein